MPTVASAVRSTGIISSEAREARDVSPALLQLEPDEGPLTTILGAAGMKEATDRKIEWYEDELNPRYTKLSASLTSSAGTMSVNDPTFLRAGDLVKIGNGEIVRVSATPTANPVSITRGVGETAAAAHNSGDACFIVSNAHAEGASKRSLLMTQRAQVFNYLQIVRTGFGWTNTLKGTKTLAGDDKDAERAKKLIEHKRDIEQALWFGERYVDSLTSSSNLRTTRGVFAFIVTNSKNVADLTEEELEDFLRVVFRYGSRDKVLFCAPAVITAINRFARGKLKTVSGEQSYGVTMTEFLSAGRRVKLVEHKLFTNDNLNDLSGIAGYAACLDMQNVKVRYLRGKFVGLMENIQTPGDDQEQHEYISEVGLELNLEKTHGELTGVAG